MKRRLSLLIALLATACRTFEGEPDPFGDRRNYSDYCRGQLAVAQTRAETLATMGKRKARESYYDCSSFIGRQLRIADSSRPKP